jgi:hypothetical protein
MKLSTFFRPFLRRKAPPTPRFWVQSRFNRARRHMRYSVIDDTDGEPVSISTCYRDEAQQWAVLLNAGLLQLPLAEAERCTELLTAARMVELIHSYGPELYEMPPDQDEQFSMRDIPDAAPPKPDLYSGDPFGGHVKLTPYEGPPPGYQAMGSAFPLEPVAEVTCILTGALGENPDDCTTHEHESDTTSPWSGVAPIPQMSAEEAAKARPGCPLTAKEKEPDDEVYVTHHVDLDTLQGEPTVSVRAKGGAKLSDMTVQELEDTCAMMQKIATEAARPFAGELLTQHTGHRTMRAIHDALTEAGLPVPEMCFDRNGILQMDLAVLMSPEAARSDALIDRVFSCASRVDLLDPARPE